MSPPKYLDPIVLAAALAVFLVGGFPMLGFAVAAIRPIAFWRLPARSSALARLAATS